MDWDSIDPKNNKMSPLCNNSFTRTSWWFMMCTQYFPRIRHKFYKEMMEKLKKRIKSDKLELNIILKKDVLKKRKPWKKL
jgi:hypothetical protein